MPYPGYNPSKARSPTHTSTLETLPTTAISESSARPQAPWSMDATNQIRHASTTSEKTSLEVTSHWLLGCAWRSGTVPIWDVGSASPLLEDVAAAALPPCK